MTTFINIVNGFQIVGGVSKAWRKNQITQITKSSSVSFSGANWTNIIAGVDAVPMHATKAEVYGPRSLRTILTITGPYPFLIITKDRVYV